MFVDTHAHLYSEYYDDIEAIINEANCCGVKYIINSGVDNKTNQEVLSLSKTFPCIYGTLGIHPESEGVYESNDLTFIESHINDEKIIAIGEIGLDYHYDGYDKEKQIMLFTKQLAIAEKYHIPVVIHSRQATQDTLDILKQYRVKGVIHSFSGSYEVAKEYIKLGFKLGINGVITFKNANLKDVVKKIGLEAFVLETDSPYLTPTPLRGQKNSPGNIKHIVAFLGKELNLSDEEISKITNENIISIFDKFIY